MNSAASICQCPPLKSLLPVNSCHETLHFTRHGVQLVIFALDVTGTRAVAPGTWQCNKPFFGALAAREQVRKSTASRLPSCPDKWTLHGASDFTRVKIYGSNRKTLKTADRTRCGDTVMSHTSGTSLTHLSTVACGNLANRGPNLAKPSWGVVLSDAILGAWKVQHTVTQRYQFCISSVDLI